MADSPRPSLDEFSSVSAEDLSTPVFAAAEGVSTPVPSSHRGHARSASILSTMSSLTVPSFGGAGAGRHFYDVQVLGPHSICGLVDGVVSNADSSRRSASMRSTGLTGSSFKPPTQYDIPPVSLPKLAKIDREEFDRYLSDITHEYDSFYGTKFANGDHGRDSSRISSSTAGDGPRDDEVSVISASFSTCAQNDEDVSLSTSPLPADLDDTPEPIELTSLSTIPDIFFEEDFQLDNPRVFDVVSEKSQAVDDGADGAASRLIVSNSILQEKLTWYTDTVELHLIEEISKASKSFFSALDDLKNIRERAAELVQRTGSIGRCLETVDHTIAVAGIKSLKLRQRRRNIALLGEALNQLSLVLVKSDEAESVLLGKNKFSECIDLVDAVEALIAGEYDSKGFVESWTSDFHYPLRSLRSLKGLEELRENIAKLRNKAGESYATTLSTVLVEDIQKHVASVESEATMKRLGGHIEARFKKTKSQKKDVDTGFMHISEALVDNLKLILHNLIRSGNVLLAIKLYKEAVIKEVKKIVLDALPARDDDTRSISSSITGRGGNSGASSLGRALREMSPLEVEKMLYQCYSSLSELLRRVLAHQKLLLDVILSADNSPSGMMEINDILPSAVSITEVRMSKILKVRREQTGLINMKQFLTYYFLNGMFISECEALCGDPCSSLSDLLGEQIRQFIASYHLRCEKDLSDRMLKDQWKELEITPQFQALVDRVVESADTTPAEWTELIFSVTTPQHYEETSSVTADLSEKKWPRNVFIGNNSYIIANAATIVAGLSESYLESALLLPHLAGEIITNLLRLLRLFNVTTKKLILGAEATKTAGLKHITIKHMSLASESLKFVCALSEYIQKFCYKVVQNSSLVHEFSDVMESLLRHREEIHEKFISLMTDKVNTNCAIISTTDWSIATNEPHKYMQDLVKSTSILVKVLNGILPKEASISITSVIFDVYKRRLVDAYTKIEFKSTKEKKSMLEDVAFFKEKLGNLDGAGNCADIIYEYVNAMPAPEPESLFDAGSAHDGGNEVVGKLENDVSTDKADINASIKSDASKDDTSMMYEDSSMVVNDASMLYTDDSAAKMINGSEKTSVEDAVTTNQASKLATADDSKLEMVSDVIETDSQNVAKAVENIDSGTASDLTENQELKRNSQSDDEFQPVEIKEKNEMESAIESQKTSDLPAKSDSLDESFKASSEQAIEHEVAEDSKTSLKDDSETKSDNGPMTVNNIDESMKMIDESHNNIAEVKEKDTQKTNQTETTTEEKDSLAKNDSNGKKQMSENESDQATSVEKDAIADEIRESSKETIAKLDNEQAETSPKPKNNEKTSKNVDRKSKNAKKRGKKNSRK